MVQMTGRWLAVMRKAACSFVLTLNRQAKRRRWFIFSIWARRRGLAFQTWLQGWQTLVSALVAFGAIYWGDHATRRNTAQLELHQCEGLTGTLITEARLIQEALRTPASAASVAGSTPFSDQAVTVPPLEDLLHGHEGEIGRLDYNERDAVLRLEIYYHVARDVLRETASLPHIGDTFVINTANKARGFDGIA